MRQPHSRLLAAAAVAALAAGALSACTLRDEKTFEDDTKVSRAVTAVHLDSRDGDVEVDASADTSTVSVHRRVDYRGDRPGGTSFSVDNGVLTLSACGSDCGVDYVVKVPAGLPVAGDTTNGSVTLTGVGPVDVRTGNGATTVDGATGPVRLRTSNGAVHVSATRGGDVDAQTSNGGVDIRTSAPQNVKAVTTSGDLRVTVAPGAYRISAHTTHGDRTVALPNDPAGPYLLDLSTTNGDLTVESADARS